MDTGKKLQKRYRTGCLIPLGLYIAVLVIGFYATRPPLITEDFSGHVARSFWVATVREADSGFEYGSVRLETILKREPALPSFRYLLPEQRITIYVGDIHHASIIEDHGDWQLIEFNYSNTYMATSIYRAYADRVEPVSYQLESSVTDALVAMLFTAFAVALYLLVALINFIRNRRAMKSEDINRD